VLRTDDRLLRGEDPRWTFEKFPDADETLTTQMKSVGEAMSIGRTFKEAFQKGIRSMEVKRFGLGLIRPTNGSSPSARTPPRPTRPPAKLPPDDSPFPIEEGKLRRKLAVPCQGRIYYIRYAFRMAGRRAGVRVDEDRPVVPDEHEGTGGF